MAAKRPWLRLYRDAIKNPKIGRLTLEGMGFWVALLMLSEDDGTLPPEEDISWHLRLTHEEVEKHLAEMVRQGLVTGDVTDMSRVTSRGMSRSYKLHDWEEHQCISDADRTARDRKQRQREREKSQKSAVTRDVTDMSRVTSRTGHGDVTRTESESDKRRVTTPTPPTTSAPAANQVGGGAGKGPVFDQFCLAMNVTPQELLKAGQGWLGFKSDFDAWIALGAIPELDVWPTITATIAKYREQNPGKLPGSARYFTPAINRAIETRKAAMPELIQASVVTGPNGKVLAPNGKPWTVADHATHIWATDYKFWVPRKAVEEMVDDATQNGWMDVMIFNLDGTARPWLPQDLAIRLQERQEARNWVGVYLRGARIESWPVRAPTSLSISVQETFQRWAAMSNILPPQEKTLEVA